MELQILYADVARHRNRGIEDMMSVLPRAIQTRIGSFRFVDDKLRHLLGRLLLFQGSKQIGYLEFPEITYSPFKRPGIPIAGLDFNITHSEEMVVCAMGEHVRVGIDIEKVRSIRPENYERFFTAMEFQRILDAADVDREFFSLWTRKESVVKCIGSGFYIDPGSFCAIDDVIWMQGRWWYIRAIEFKKDYIFHVTTDTNLSSHNVKPKEVVF